ncbi:hypothetical protein ZIOFF_016664 [Zingiber officinale]|uniref:Uncharacterized protein n=1 Tax=Zingiber officinale TaxID=94328 RepID=A0A8J5LHN7_ZINOF|nr:hypothetical protein ZIOFF_016664 [Zingiber officinale]
MQPASSDRRSTYLDALTLEIERKLRKALSSPGQRPYLLQQLFADVALEIEDRTLDIIFDKDEDQIVAAQDGIDASLCFYDVLADYYVEEPERAKCILSLIVQLWSQSFVSHIFALLFHKWLFEVSVENTETLLRYGSALVQGAGNVFWIDIQTNRKRFLSLFTVGQTLLSLSNYKSFFKIKIQQYAMLFSFQYLLEEVALVPERSLKISIQARRDLYLLLSRFLFFYDADDSLENFLKSFPTFPNAFLVGGPVDIFVIELTDQLQKLKVEPVLVHYLSRMSALRGSTSVIQSRVENDYKYKTKGMPLQLHFSWRANISDESCTTCRLGYIGSALSCGSISSACYKPLLSIALSLVLAFLLLEFYYDMREDGCILLHRTTSFRSGELEKTQKNLRGSGMIASTISILL